MKVLSILFLSFVLKASESAIIYAPEMRKYVFKFLEEAKTHNIKIDSFKTLTIRFSKRIEDYGFNGYAPNIFGQHKLILINPWSWRSFSDTKRLILISHEMGHALLKRAHEEPYVDSIMMPHVTKYLSTQFSRKSKYYWDELFSKQKTLPYISDQWSPLGND